MALQTAVQTEEELFSTLIDKIQHSKLLRVTRAPGTKYQKRIIFKFDKLDVRVSLYTQDIQNNGIMNTFNRYNIDDITKVTNITEVVDITVIDKLGNKLVTRDCRADKIKNNESEIESKLQEIRFNMGRRVYHVMIDLYRKMIDTKKQQKLRQAQDKVANKKTPEDVRQEQAEAAAALKCLRDL